MLSNEFVTEEGNIILLSCKHCCCEEKSQDFMKIQLFDKKNFKI